MINFPQLPKPKEGWKHQLHSLSVAVIDFKDGERRTRYSLDWRHNHSPKRDFQIGLKRLKDLIHKTHAGKVRFASIYSMQDDMELLRYEKGVFFTPDFPRKRQYKGYPNAKKK